MEQTRKYGKYGKYSAGYRTSSREEYIEKRSGQAVYFRRSIGDHPMFSAEC